MKKKILSIMLVAVMLGASACGNSSEEQVTAPQLTTAANLSQDWNVIQTKDTSTMKLPQDWQFEEKDDYYVIKDKAGTVKFVGFDTDKYTKKKKKKVSFSADDIKISFSSDDTAITGTGSAYSNGAVWGMREITYNDDTQNRYFIKYNSIVIVCIDTNEVDHTIIDEMTRKIERVKVDE